MRTTLRLTLLVVGLLSVQPCGAQWTTQTVTLSPGWNAVHLTLQPEPAECDAIFAALPVDSVWGWNRRFSPVEFIQDPASLIPGQPDWLVYFPPGNSLEKKQTLFILEAGKTYLVRLLNNAPVTTWTLRGRAKLRPPDSISGSYNFLGFPVSTIPPRFLDFFRPSSAHTNIYRLGADGHWSRVDQPGSVSEMRRGEAFWVFLKSPSSYGGPIQLTLDQRSGLDYGRILQEQTVRIRNASSTARSVTVRLLDSEPPVPGNYPPLSGSVLMNYWDSNLSYTSGGWKSFTSQVTYTNLPPGAEWQLRLAIRRSEMPAEGMCQSLLEITDTPASLRYVVPVTAQGQQGFVTANAAVAGAGGGGGPQAGPTPPPHRYAGLWIGSATLTNVSRPASFTPDAPEPTASEFQFRLIVHVDAQGNARLLQKVLQMWKPGTYKPDPLTLTNQIVDVPGRFVLVADDRLIPLFTGAALRDGQPVARRFSSAAFAFSTPLPMAGSGDFGTDASVFTCPVFLSYTNALNPFVHRYHPDHDNLNERFEATPLPPGQESFAIIRQIQLQFSGTDPAALGLPGWGDNQIGGYYRESIAGLHSRVLIVGGTFRLHRASTVAVLNDGL